MSATLSTPSSSETSSTIESSGTSPQARPTPWSGFKYEPVRGLIDRKISRFLRAQRKNMRRIFQERGHLDLFAQMDELRKDSTKNFQQKNTTFQRIMNEHIARSVPDAAAATEAAPAAPVGDVVVRGDATAADAAPSLVGGSGNGEDDGGGLPQLAQPGAVDGPVIEE